MTTSRLGVAWDLAHLRRHLQSVVDLELWTVPYYMTALYSVRDPAAPAYRLIQDVVHEEMLHIQLAANISNAFGLRPRFAAPVYAGDRVPHIDFALDLPSPVDRYSPYSAELGPLDRARVNTMCLIEYPEWDTRREPALREDVRTYGSIAEFYDAVRTGMTQLCHEIRGGVRQVDEFRDFYAELPGQSVVHDGPRGLAEAFALIDVITDQGEGQSLGDTDVEPEHRNTADGFATTWPHFRRFCHIRDQRDLPITYSAVTDPDPGSPGAAAQAALVESFQRFLTTLEHLFGGERVDGFGAQMAQLGGNILTCWQRGAVPRFS